MFRLNNKGFAFSTILYGLLLMGMMVMLIILSTMQTNRSSNKAFVQKIEEELNRYSLTQTEFQSIDGDSGQEYIVPTGQSGWYKIELFGAQGGNNGGRGSYTSGLIWLGDNTHLYFYIGKQGSTYNGGGSGNSSCGSNNGTGGGATDVRLQDGNWDNSSSLATRIMVAAGGGGTCGSAAGGFGGAIIGGSGAGSNGGAGGKQIGITSALGKGGNSAGAGGGGGYYGGLAGGASSGGGGGSSYISGYAGVSTAGLSGSDATSNKDLTSTFNSYTNAYFINGFMVQGVKSGNGYGKIQKISSNDRNNPPPIINSSLYNTEIRYIKDCISGSRVENSSSIDKNAWKAIQVIKDGKNIAYNKSMTLGGTDYKSKLANGKLELNSDMAKTSSSSEQCILVDLGSKVKNISDIAVWHNFYNEKTNVKKHTLYVGPSTSSMSAIVNSTDSNSIDSYETSNGSHYSAWGLNLVNSNIPDGTYYIMSAASDNLFVTSYGMGKNAKLDYFNGEASQKWTFTKINDTYYQITSAADSETFSIMNGTDIDDSFVGIDEFRGNYAWNKWKFQSTDNGTFYIISEFGTRLGFKTSSSFYNNRTDLTSQKTLRSNSSSGTDSASNRVQRFRIIPATY